MKKSLIFLFLTFFVLFGCNNSEKQEKVVNQVFAESEVTSVDIVPNVEVSTYEYVKTFIDSASTKEVIAYLLDINCKLSAKEELDLLYRQDCNEILATLFAQSDFKGFNSYGQVFYEKAMTKYVCEYVKLKKGVLSSKEELEIIFRQDGAQIYEVLFAQAGFKGFNSYEKTFYEKASLSSQNAYKKIKG